MKRNPFVALIVLSMALGLAGCLRFTGVQGSGISKTEKRNLVAFKSIETQGAYEVEVSCQKPRSFEVEADDNILPLIQTEVRDGVLYVSSSKSYNPSKPVLLRIALPDLESITNTGAGKARVSDVKNDKFEIHSTGAADMTATGQTKTVVIRSTGAGKVDAHDLHAENADVNAMGAATIDVYASERLDASLSGASNVTYSGNPKVINKNISGAGGLSKKE